jgi:hypothetical protein
VKLHLEVAILEKNTISSGSLQQLTYTHKYFKQIAVKTMQRRAAPNIHHDAGKFQYYYIIIAFQNKEIN